MTSSSGFTVVDDSEVGIVEDACGVAEDSACDVGVRADSGMYSAPSSSSSLSTSAEPTSPSGPPAASALSMPNSSQDDAVFDRAEVTSSWLGELGAGSAGFGVSMLVILCARAVMAW